MLICLMYINWGDDKQTHLLQSAWFVSVKDTRPVCKLSEMFSDFGIHVTDKYGLYKTHFTLAYFQG